MGKLFCLFLVNVTSLNAMFSTLKLPNINKKIAAILHVTLTLLFDKVLLDYKYIV